MYAIDRSCVCIRRTFLASYSHKRRFLLIRLEHGPCGGKISQGVKALKKVDMDKWGRQIAILNEVLVSLYEEVPLDLLTITRKTDQLHEAQSELRLLLQIHPQPNADDARHHLM